MKQDKRATSIAAFVALFALAFSPLCAQENVRGTVYEYTKEHKKQPLLGATVHWLQHPSRGVITARDGSFTLQRSADTDDERIVVRHIAYYADTLDVRGKNTVEIVLQERAIELDDVEVQGNRTAADIHRAPVRMEVVTAEDIEKDACCDLSGCFNTSAAVEPQVTDVLTDKRELQILGLAGVYNQVLVDGMPSLMTGLNSSYGLNYIPGAFIHRISVVKGANSVLQGYEAISGMVDVRIKEPNETERLYANVFANSALEKQLNLAWAEPIGNGWNGMVAGHVVQPANRIDKTGDSFLDMPLVTRYSAFAKSNYSDEDSPWRALLSARYTNEERIGGDKGFDRARHAGSAEIYGQVLDNQRVEGYSKVSLDADEDTHWSAALSAAWHKQDAWYGTTQYAGTQRNAYAHLQVSSRVWDEATTTVGVSYRMEELDEELQPSAQQEQKQYGGIYAKSEYAPGIYTETMLQLLDDQLLLLPGIRVDFHTLHGAIVTPRFHAKYAFNDLTTLRATIGTGTRTVNFWSENSTLLASGRNVVFTEGLKAERAVTTGMSLSHIVDIADVITTVSVDFFHTAFLNQVYADYERQAGTVQVYNIANGSTVNSAQIEASAEISPELTLKLAYNWLDAQQTINGIQTSKPFVVKHKVLAVASYTPDGTPWQFTANAHWYGAQRLPSTEHNPEAFRRPTESTPYTLLNAQATYQWNTLEFYAGMENVLDFRQNNPIIDAEHPFGPYFDTSFIWGPVKGREAYMGIRYVLQ